MSTTDVTASISAICIFSTSHLHKVEHFSAFNGSHHLHRSFNNPIIPCTNLPLISYREWTENAHLKVSMYKYVNLDETVFIMIWYDATRSLRSSIQHHPIYQHHTHTLKWASSFHHKWTRNSETVCEGTHNSIIYGALSQRQRQRQTREEMRHMIWRTGNRQPMNIIHRLTG